ncbi:MAG: DNA methyltransferase [bacterium]|nr:DNA methyltransferase [bacterium]
MALHRMTADTQPWVFILGREPHLSVTEIAAVLGDGADWQHAELSREVLTLPIRDAEAPALMDRLAGTQKIGTVWGSVPLASPNDIARAVIAYTLQSTNADQRVRFGFSVYDLGGGTRGIDRARAALQRNAREIKTQIEEAGRTTRHVTSNDATLSSVTVTKQKLLPEHNGIEVLALVTRDRILLARTLAVQPFESWSRRDYGRPRRDARSGMLPPKLAHMMVNLALQSTIENRQSTMILDPFCGSGTVLMEAALLGVPHIIGTDASEDAIADARENIAWLRNAPSPASRGGAGGGANISIRPCDVRALTQCITEPVDAIVTEPSLGPPQQRANTATVQRELLNLYLAAFAQFARVLRPGGTVVFVLPTFQTTHVPELAPARFCAALAPLGFTHVNTLPQPLCNHPVLRNNQHLPYAREGQRVGRNILVLRLTI